MITEGELNFEKPNFWASKRYLIAFLIACANYTVSCLRTNISIAIIDMTRHKTKLVGNETIIFAPEFQLDSIQKGIMLGVSSYGYMLSILCGYAVKVIGGASSMGIGLLAMGILSSLSPTFLRTNFYLFLIGRFLEGVCEMLLFCSPSEIWSKWASPRERSRLVSLPILGTYCGITTVFPLFGFLAYNWGWFSIFYVSGGISLVLGIIWSVTIFNDPSEDKWISKKEVSFLQRELADIFKAQEVVYSMKRVVSSPVFWSGIFAKISRGLSFSLITLCLPLYIQDRTNLNIKDIGFVSALPVAVTVFVTPVGSFLCDYLQNKKILSTTNVYKLYIGGGLFVASALVFATTFVSNFNACLCLLILSKVATTVYHIGIHPLALCVAPRFSSVIFGYFGIAYSCGSFLNSMLYGVLVKNHTQVEWSMYFVCSSSVLLVSALVFLYFGSADAQPWVYTVDDQHEKSATTYAKSVVP